MVCFLSSILFKHEILIRLFGHVASRKDGKTRQTFPKKVLLFADVLQTAKSWFTFSCLCVTTGNRKEFPIGCNCTNYERKLRNWQRNLFKYLNVYNEKQTEKSFIWKSNFPSATSRPINFCLWKEMQIAVILLQDVFCRKLRLNGKVRAPPVGKRFNQKSRKPKQYLRVSY